MKLGHTYYVYILECKDGNYYIGITNDLDTRVEQHNSGDNKNCYTYKRRPVVLKYFERFKEVKQAIEWEKQLKGWSRKKKEALFKEDWNEVRKLSLSTLRQCFDRLSMTKSDKG